MRLVPTGEVVTVIELLSHTNKQRGKNREDHVTKREDILDTRVGFVEIDLLRAGAPMPYAEQGPESDYRLLIRRRERQFQFRLYPFGVRQPIPRFRLPLLPEDEEPLVDLNQLLADVYERAAYELVIRYDQPPEPPLQANDAEWAQQQLANSLQKPKE